MFMQCKRIKRLTDAEFQSTAKTELFSNLVAHKFHIEADPAAVIQLLDFLEEQVSGTWYFLRTPVPHLSEQTGIIYLSNENDVKHMESL